MIDSMLTTENMVEQVAETFADAINSRHFGAIVPFICEDTQLQTSNQLIMQGKTVVLNYWAKKLEEYPVLKAEVINAGRNNPKIVLLDNSNGNDALNQPLWEVIVENGKCTLLRESCN